MKVYCQSNRENNMEGWMRQHWKQFVPLILSGGLVACSAVSSPEPNVTVKTVMQSQQSVKLPPLVGQRLPSSPGSRFQVAREGDKLIFGRKEWVFLPAFNKAYVAKINPRAAFSSLNATNIVNFKRNGQDWISFQVMGPKRQTSGKISLPVARWVTVKGSLSKPTQRYPVVVDWLEIGPLKDRTELVLIDHSDLSYPLVLGRIFLKDVAVVNMKRQFVQNQSAIIE
jgi:hypothetical protein